MNSKRIQVSLLISQLALALCLLFHIGDRQALEDAKYALTVAQAIATQFEKRREA